MLRQQRWVLPVAALAPLLWGTTYATTTELLPPDRPLTAAVLRALPAGLLLLAVSRRLPPRGWWWRAAVLGGLNIGVFFALLFVGAYRLPGGVAATVGALQPLVVLGLATVLLGERAGRRALVAAVLGVGGVALLVLRADAALDAVGLLAATGGAVSMAVGVVLAKRWGRPAPLPAVTSWQLLAGGLLLVPVALVVEGVLPASELDAAALLGYGWLTVAGTALAYVVWFLGVGALPSGAVSSLGLLAPLVATVLGWAVLGQALTGWQVAGAVLVLVAVVLAQRAGARTRPRATVTPHRAPVLTGRVPAGAAPPRCLPCEV
jgi:probable blue pigment (indigoidine) exporter